MSRLHSRSSARWRAPRGGAIVLAISLAVGVGPWAPAYGRTWVVENDPDNPVDQIGAVVIAAAFGDSILIGPGTYYEHIPIQEKELTLIGTEGPDATILDGSRAIDGREGAVLYAIGRLMKSLTLQGLTFRNGTGVPHNYGSYTHGGGIFWEARYPGGVLEIRDCAFEDNEAEEWGGAIFAVVPGLHLIDCWFGSNRASWGLDAGIDAGTGTIEGCTFELSYEGGRAAIGLIGADYLRIADCEFIGTEAGHQQRSISGGATRLEIENNRFIDRVGTLATGLDLSMPAGHVDQEVSVELRNNLFVRAGSKPPSEDVYIQIAVPRGEITIEGNTFVDAPDVVTGVTPGSLHVRRNIFLGTAFRYVAVRGEVACNDSWPDPLVPGQFAIEFRDNISKDPLFCDPSALDFRISDTSRCAAENAPEGCGQIGWFPPACRLTPVIEQSWGQIKQRFVR